MTHDLTQDYTSSDPGWSSDERSSKYSGDSGQIPKFETPIEMFHMVARGHAQLQVRRKIQ